jgi:hypothetical protein
MLPFADSAPEITTLPETERFVRFEPISNSSPFEENSFLSARFNASSPMLRYDVFELLVVLGVRPVIDERLT